MKHSTYGSKIKTMSPIRVTLIGHPDDFLKLSQEICFDIMRHLLIANVSKKTVERELKKMNNVRYLGSGTNGYWEITDKQ